MAANTCDGCLTCAAGFQLSADKKSCTACNVAQCTGGYDTNTCNCKACASGYQGAACTACAATRPNCATMATNTCNGCATCALGYQLSAGSCIAVSSTNFLCRYLVHGESHYRFAVGAFPVDHCFSHTLRSPCPVPQCTDVPKCQTMSANKCDGCVTCAGKFKLSGDKKTCSVCPDVPSCTTYATNDCACTDCANNFQLSSGTCTQVRACGQSKRMRAPVLHWLAGE